MRNCFSNAFFHKRIRKLSIASQRAPVGKIVATVKCEDLGDVLAQDSFFRSRWAKVRPASIVRLSPAGVIPDSAIPQAKWMAQSAGGTLRTEVIVPDSPNRCVRGLGSMFFVELKDGTDMWNANLGADANPSPCSRRLGDRPAVDGANRIQVLPSAIRSETRCSVARKEMPGRHSDENFTLLPAE
jgi:hypothetical protein